MLLNQDQIMALLVVGLV
uniref:Paired amphipathic helix repeat-containing family protein n=1 Tax=Rhizophora mucronata TaxID=61149 RepID=A0A2P2R3S0_RHIMU